MQMTEIVYSYKKISGLNNMFYYITFISVFRTMMQYNQYILSKNNLILENPWLVPTNIRCHIIFIYFAQSS